MKIEADNATSATDTVTCRNLPLLLLNARAGLAMLVGAVPQKRAQWHPQREASLSFLSVCCAFLLAEPSDEEGRDGGYGAAAARGRLASPGIGSAHLMS